jgi:lipoprotein-releasing system ATP-binding protein
MTPQAASEARAGDPDRSRTDVSKPVLVGRGLSKTYGSGSVATTALHDCDLDLHPGRILVIMGPSGSGKSTLLHLLAGLDEPTSGTVELRGQPLTSLSEAEAARLRAAEIGFVLQRDNLIPALTLTENVAAPMLLAGRSRDESVERAREYLRRVGLAHRVDAFPAQVSGGEAQRAAIARACAGEPALVFADEPTGALDRQAGRSVMELFRELVTEIGAAAAIVTHDEELARSADEVVRMVDGRVVGSETNPAG